MPLVKTAKYTFGRSCGCRDVTGPEDCIPAEGVDPGLNHAISSKRFNLGVGPVHLCRSILRRGAHTRSVIAIPRLKRP